MTCLPKATKLLQISIIFKMKEFSVLQLAIPNREREYELIMNLLSSEEATKFKARRIALASALKIELADGNRRNNTGCRKTAVDATLSPSPEQSVYILEYSDVMDLISAKCC
jgi:hypothetical protein